MLVNGAAQIEETATQLTGRLRNSISRQRSMQSSDNCVAAWLSSISCSVTRFGDSFVKMARKVNEVANFILVQLIEQERGIYVYDKRHSDYARRNKIDLAGEKISH
jgi:hypothetical protein